jgi:antitoxin (DNA-binding transcriptional repressor) of toxin-antitoxin stability system
VNTHDPKKHLSLLVSALEDGKEIVIARKGVPEARSVSATPEKKAFVFGQHAPLISPGILDDWEETDEAIKKMFPDHLPDPE